MSIVQKLGVPVHFFTLTVHVHGSLKKLREQGERVLRASVI